MDRRRGATLSRGAMDSRPAGFESRGDGIELRGWASGGSRGNTESRGAATGSRGTATDSRGAPDESCGGASDSRSWLGEGVDLGFGCKMLCCGAEVPGLETDGEAR